MYWACIAYTIPNYLQQLCSKDILMLSYGIYGRINRYLIFLNCNQLTFGQLPLGQLISSWFLLFLPVKTSFKTCLVLSMSTSLFLHFTSRTPEHSRPLVSTFFSFAPVTFLEFPILFFLRVPNKFVLRYINASAKEV